MSAAQKGARLLLSHLARHGLAMSSPFVLLGALGLSPAVYAQVVNLNIPAQPLAGALQAFGQQTGMQLIYPSPLVEGKKSQAVGGQMDAVDGLRQLLGGSGLAYQISGNSVVLTPPVAADTVQLSATQVDGVGLGNVSEGTGSYTVGAVNVGKSAATLKETPQTVSVMTRQRIEDQKLTSIHDVLNQTTGVSVYQGSSIASRYLSRGFEITSFRVDGGTPVFDTAYAMKDMDMGMYDRVEVLRGSDGIFSGAGEPGGTINLIRKRPTAYNQISMETSVGSWNNYRTELDVSGPLGFDGRLRGRSVLVYNDKDMFYDKADMDRKFFYGVLEADVTDSTLVLAGMTYDDYSSTDQPYGWPRSITGADLKLPRSQPLGGANDNSKWEAYSYFVRVDQQLGDNWTTTLDTLYATKDHRRSYYNFYGAIDPDTGAGSSAAWQGNDPKVYSKSLDWNFKGSENLLGFNNDFLVGWSWQERQTDAKHYSTNNYRDIPDIFTFDPDDYRSERDIAPFTYRDILHVTQNGLYGSWRVQVTDPMHVIVGGRYSDYKYRYEVERANGTSTLTPYEDKNVFTPYAGVTYDLTSQWTAYASISEIYKSQAGLRSESGSPLNPITGMSYELGLKGQLLDGRLNTYAALYYVKRDGEGVQQYDAGNNCCYRDDGRTVSKGIDLEVSGEIFNRFEATAGYTYNHVDNTVTGNSYNSATPKHLFKLFGTYRLTGALAKLKVGAGVVAQSPSYVSGTIYERDGNGDIVESNGTYKFSQAGYSVWNSFAEYQFDKHWSAAFNVNNLFDKRYYSTVGFAEYGNFYGEPRNYVLTVRAKY